MSYNYSQIDKDNLRYFKNNNSSNTLTKISVLNGKIRGVSPVEIDFHYPITAIVGENGAGKSTILALVSCAFHNDTSFCPQNRVRLNAKKPRFYYTYGDFFTFSRDETGISGIEIRSEFHTPNGIKQDIRKKKPSGKWNDFNRRPKRAVSYLGINRIVPPSESNPHRHYCRYFTGANLDKDHLQQLRDSMSSIIGRNYTEIEMMKYNAYRLFEAKRNGVTYTGFNMGAGENAVLGLILEILSAGEGALIVVDEIELGLHTQAQVRLIDELKKLCKKYKCQIVCSTHSKDILQQLPPEGRVYLKRSDDQTEIIPNISAEYAFGKLSGANSDEVSVFVEDEIGERFLQSMLPQRIRERIRIFQIGSDQAVLKHMAVHYREGSDSFIAFLDGDKRSQKNNAVKKVSNHLEDRYRKDFTDEQFNSYMFARLNYLPGNEWPEKEVIEGILKADNLDELESAWDGNSTDDIRSVLEQALTAGKHNEFFEISKTISLPRDQVIADLMRFYKKLFPEAKTAVTNAIDAILKDQK